MDDETGEVTNSDWPLASKEFHREFLLDNEMQTPSTQADNSYLRSTQRMSKKTNLYVDSASNQVNDTYDRMPSEQQENYGNIHWSSSSDDDEMYRNKKYSKSSEKLKIKKDNINHRRRHRKNSKHRKKTKHDNDLCYIREGMLAKRIRWLDEEKDERIRWLDDRVDKLEKLLSELLEEKFHKMLEERVTYVEDLLHEYLGEDRKR